MTRPLFVLLARQTKTYVRNPSRDYMQHDRWVAAKHFTACSAYGQIYHTLRLRIHPQAVVTRNSGCKALPPVSLSCFERVEIRKRLIVDSRRIRKTKRVYSHKAVAANCASQVALTSIANLFKQVSPLLQIVVFWREKAHRGGWLILLLRLQNRTEQQRRGGAVIGAIGPNLLGHSH